ncbi:MAG: hypothetical protein ACOX6U_10095 [Oscillospiraceae bacterium]|jgi:hypothetical protein
MELCREIILQILQDKGGFHTNRCHELVEQTSYRALCEIKAILEMHELSDFACIERIVEVFERLGTHCGSRHDF